MKIKKLEIESEILGKGVFQIDEEIDEKSFPSIEKKIINKYNPYYIQCILQAEDLSVIHSFENSGFRFVEFRLKKILDTYTFKKIGDLAFYPYVLQQLTGKDDLEKALLLINTLVGDDRFSRDPVIPGNLSRERLKKYLTKSYNNHPKEFIYQLVNKNDNKLLGIKSGEIIGKKEVFFYHTALNKDIDQEKFALMLDSLIISKLIEQEIEIFYSVNTVFNIMEMDLSISELKYKVIKSEVILRKVYPR